VRDYGRRHDDDGTVHARVRNVGRYSVQTVLYTRSVAGVGTIRCELLRNRDGVGRRLVQLVADYVDAGVAVQRIVMCDDELDEKYQLGRLERTMLEAMRRPAL
jgi:hypothetical protein